MEERDGIGEVQEWDQEQMPIQQISTQKGGRAHTPENTHEAIGQRTARLDNVHDDVRNGVCGHSSDDGYSADLAAKFDAMEGIGCAIQYASGEMQIAFEDGCSLRIDSGVTAFVFTDIAGRSVRHPSNAVGRG